MRQEPYKEYQDIAAAIIKQALDDRCKVLKEKNCNDTKIKALYLKIVNARGDLMQIDRLYSELDRVEIAKGNIDGKRKEIDRFLAGDWFESLSYFMGIDPEYLRDRVKEEGGIRCSKRRRTTMG